MKMITIVIALTASLAAARTTEGVVFPETVLVEGTKLKLNGTGLRTKTMFKVKVYVAGLYLENPTHDGPAVIQSDQPRRMQLSMLRDLSKDQIADAIREAFERNAGRNITPLKARLDRFVSVVIGAKKGDQLILTYVPGRGTVIADASGVRATIEGKDFADALFSVWLGSHPVDDDLKKGLLAG